jgi:hypothetical protein
MFVLVVAVGCSSVPSYEGGPDSSQQYGIVQPEANVKLWKVDGKTALNKDGETFVSPGDHTFTFRIDHPMGSEDQHPFLYIDMPIRIVEGHRFRVAIDGEYEKGPPYDYKLKIARETKIAGYAKE